MIWWYNDKMELLKKELQVQPIHELRHERPILQHAHQVRAGKKYTEKYRKFLKNT